MLNYNSRLVYSHHSSSGRALRGPSNTLLWSLLPLFNIMLIGIFTQPSAESVSWNVHLFVCLFVCLSVTPRRRLKLNKSQKTHSYWNLKNIKNGIFKKFKKSKMTPKNPQNQKSKECSNELMLKKIIRHLRLAKNNFQKIQKLKNYPLKPPKTKNQRRSALMN